MLALLEKLTAKHETDIVGDLVETNDEILDIVLERKKAVKDLEKDIELLEKFIFQNN